MCRSAWHILHDAQLVCSFRNTIEMQLSDQLNKYYMLDTQIKQSSMNTRASHVTLSRVNRPMLFPMRIFYYLSVGFSSSTTVNINVFNAITLKSSPLLDY